MIPHRFRYHRGSDAIAAIRFPTADTPIQAWTIDNALRPATPGCGDDRVEPIVRVTSDVVKSRCWCDSHFVEVPIRDVVNGRTVSCSRRQCRPC